MARPKHPCLFLPPASLFLFLFSFPLHQILESFAADTISANHALSGTQTLTSKGGKFALGFFRPGNSSQSRYYIGIWYNNVSQHDSVWVANRETPVTNPATSELKISDDGNLVLIDQSNSAIWSTGILAPSNSTHAVLLDTGNLQLRDHFNSSKVLWQSFEHPTNTWLPGGRLGMNRLNKRVQRITAWKNSADPAPGIFSLEADPNGTSQYYILWNMTTILWRSGIWNGHIFTSMPEMTAGYFFNVEYITNDEESYFTYSVRDGSMITRSILDVTGQMKQLVWTESEQKWTLFWSQPRQQCQVYALCGAFGSCNDNVLPFCKCVKGFSVKYPSDWELNDHSGGCERNNPLQCQGSNNSSGNAGRDKFYMMSNMRLPNNSHIVGAGTSKDCESACLSNCSCTAYSYSGIGCIVWYGDLLNLQEQYDGSGAGTLYLRLAWLELPSSESKKGTVTWIVACVTSCFIACVGIFWFIIWRRRRRRRMTSARKAAKGTLVPFRYSELRHATKNFSEKLGGGGFGSVFKGSLPDSTAIAVKRLEGLRQGEKQFRAEVGTIGTIHHVNLTRLLGFCTEGTKKLLVYEYMPKGSLDKQIFRRNSTVLDWRTRYQIAVGVARGLEYLHEKCRDCIIHCDIKPENILLDESFLPKVADFGLAKLLGRDFSRVLTTMRGTVGYLAPEWITGVAITAKADVYSYGMMLLEIISGRRNAEGTEVSGAVYFPELAAGKLIAGDVRSLLDDRLSGEFDMEELERACRIACWCIQDDESIRPTMNQVVQVLEGFLQVSMPPIPRSIRLLSESPEKMNDFSDRTSN